MVTATMNETIDIPTQQPRLRTELERFDHRKIDWLDRFVYNRSPIPQAVASQDFGRGVDPWAPFDAVSAREYREGNEPTFEQVFDSTIANEYWPVAAARWAGDRILPFVGLRDEIPEEPGFNAFDWFRDHEAELEPWEQRTVYDPTILSSRSEQELMLHMRRLRAFHEHDEVLGRAGLTKGLTAGLMIGLLDPLNIFLGAGMAKLATVDAAKSVGLVNKLARVYNSGRIGRVGVEVAGGFVATITGESVLVATQSDYTVDRAASVVVASTILDAGIQGLIASALKTRGLQLPDRLDSSKIQVGDEVHLKDGSMDVVTEVEGEMFHVEQREPVSRSEVRSVRKSLLEPDEDPNLAYTRWTPPESRQVRRARERRTARASSKRGDPKVPSKVVPPAPDAPPVRVVRLKDSGDVVVAGEGGRAVGLSKAHTDELLVARQVAKDATGRKKKGSGRTRSRQSLSKIDAELAKRAKTETLSMRVERVEAGVVRYNREVADFTDVELLDSVRYLDRWKDKGDLDLVKAEMGRRRLDPNTPITEPIPMPDEGDTFGQAAEASLIGGEVKMILRPMTGPELRHANAERLKASRRQKWYEDNEDIRARRVEQKETRHGQRKAKGNLQERRFRSDPATHGRGFSEALKTAARAHPLGAAVEVKSPLFYADPRTLLFQSEDGLGGVAVTEGGDLVSVFKHPESDANINELLHEASVHAVTLDAFDINGFLPSLYAEHGFRPAARVPFNPEFAPEGWPTDLAGTPDVVLMVRDVDGVSGLPEIPTGTGGYESVRESVPVFADYDEAEAVQKAAVGRVKLKRRGMKKDAPEGSIALAMGAAGRTEFTPGPLPPEVYNVATSVETRGRLTVGAAVAGTHDVVGRAISKTSKAGSIGPLGDIRRTVHGYARGVGNIMIDMVVPLSGHVNGRSIYAGERMEEVFRQINHWKGKSIHTWEKFTTQVTGVVQTGAKARSVGEAFGINHLRKESRLVIEDSYKTFEWSRRYDEEIATRNAAGEDVADLTARRNALDAKVTAVHEKLAPGKHSELIELFDAHRVKIADLHKSEVVRSNVRDWLEAQYQANKDLTAIQVNKPDIKNATDFDEFAEALAEAADEVNELLDIKVHDSAWYLKNKGWDAARAEHLELMLADLNNKGVAVNMAPGNAKLDKLIDLTATRFSTRGTQELHSGLRHQAATNYFLKQITDELGQAKPFRSFHGEGMQFGDPDSVVAWLQRNMVEGGVDINDAVQLRDANLTIGKMSKLWDNLTERTMNTTDSPLADLFWGTGQNMAVAAYLVKTPISIINEVMQTTALMMARNETFTGKLDAFVRTFGGFWREIALPERKAIREWLAGFESLSETRLGRGFEMAGYDPANLRATSAREGLLEEGGFAETIFHSIFTTSEHIAKLMTEGKIGDYRIPALNRTTMDGITRAIRRVSVMGHHKWFMLRVEDFAALDSIVRTGEVGDFFPEIGDDLRGQDWTGKMPQLIKELKKRGAISHEVNVEDYGTVKQFLDSPQLEEMARRFRDGEGMDVVGGTRIWTGTNEEVNSYRAMLDHIALYESTTTPTAGTKPLSTAGNAPMRMLMQFMNFGLAFSGQNAQLQRVRSSQSSMTMMGLLVGASMFDFFARDVVFHDWETAQDRWENDTQGDRLVKYIHDVIGRTGFTGMADRFTNIPISLMFGDPIEQQMAAQFALIPPAMGYGSDFIRAASLLPDIIGPGELSRGQREIVRRATVLGNWLPLRQIAPEEQPPSRK